MNDKVELVEYQELFSIKVGRFLLSRGFDLESRPVIHGQQNRSFDILRKDPDAKRSKFPFRLITQEPRRALLGRLLFNNNGCDTSSHNLVFEVYGRNCVELIRQLVDEMVLTFNIKATIRLVHEQPRVEILPADYPW